uniref:Reticulon-like protein n=1 Tax=Kalanchoe fedtschenkoi TaxID=63787 RepID=A0A7N0ULU4_KALFE
MDDASLVPRPNQLRHPTLDIVVATSSPPTSPASVPLRELLCFSPSPLRRSRTRLADKVDMVGDPAASEHHRRKHRNRSGQLSSPRNVRRSRRRLEQEEREVGSVEEAGKAKKKRNNNRTTKKEMLSLNAPVPASSTALTRTDASSEDLVILDRLGLLFVDLVMWRDVAKSSLWFGFGCLCFLSSCFASGVSFSIFSGMSQLGLLFLALSFFSNTICQRNNATKTKEFKLTEDDVLRASRLFLPYVNLTIAKGREIFSGEPSMTLKVAPILLLGAQYGHLLTFKRIFALGFFTSFTAPRFYDAYAAQINSKAEFLRWWFLEVWRGCNQKKIVVGSAVSAFWNLSTLKTRIVAAFITLVILQYKRHCHQEVEQKQDKQAKPEVKEPGERKEEKLRLCHSEVERKQDELAKVDAKEHDEKKEENNEAVVVKRKYKKKKQVEDEKLQQAILVLEEELGK